MPPARDQFWVGYCRKSTDTEDKQVHTLRDQTAMITAYHQGLPADERARHPLRMLEEARSAYHPGRPVFGKILEMASRGEVYGVIVVHPNRISRNHSDSGAFVQRLVDRQITCLATTGGKRYTGADSNDIFMLTLEGAMSWKDSRDKGDRILQAMRMRAGEGRNMGPVPVGYRSVFRPDGTRVVEVDPRRGPLVRRLFELAATGSHSTRDLVVEAAKMGLDSREGRRLTKSSVHALLHKPFYKGTIQFNGILAEGVHRAIVEESIWDRARRSLDGRRTDAGRPMDLTLRDLFVFGKLLRCPKCGRALCPYRAKGRYIYYECKNTDTACGVCVAQGSLVEQLPLLLSGVFLSPEDIERLRDRLMEMHQRRGAGEAGHRKALMVEYDAVQKEIGEVFAQRKDAVALGVEDVVDRRLGELKIKRDGLRGRLDATDEHGTAWIERVIRSFELAKLLQEAILFGSRHPREAALKAVVSNLSVDGKKLILKLRSPFREGTQRGERPDWWAGLYDVRTEVTK